MPGTLPRPIVACLDALAVDLAAWCAEGRDASLERHEAAVLARVGAVLPTVLQAVVEAATSGLDLRLRRAAQTCPGCGRRTEPWQERERQVATRCGTLTLARPWYHCAPCGRGWSVVETVLAVERGARLSVGLRAWLVRLGAATVYRDGAVLLAELTGLELGPETIRRHTTAAGLALDAEEQAAAARVEATREPAEPVDAAPGILLVEVDGCLLRFRDGWKEIKLGLVGGVVDGEVVAPSYVATREAVERFGPRLAAAAARRGALAIERWEGGLIGRGLAALPPVALLGDGAKWIWELADEHFGGRVEVLDYFHAAEHLHTLAAALFADDPAVATTWAETRAAELLARGPNPVLAALRAARAPSSAAAEVLRRERGYFRTNAERLDYPTLRLDGLPIGSGAIESAADHVVQRRMKRAGMRWSDDGAQALLVLRARLRSGRPLLPPRARAA